METPSGTPDQICGSCRQPKPETDYSPSYRGKPGTWCKPCFAAYNRGVRKTSVPAQARICPHCGGEYTPRYDKAVTTFCSRACKDRAKNERRQDAVDAAKPNRVCPTCGVALASTKRADARFCSIRCASRAHNVTRKMERRSGSRSRRRGLLSVAELGDRDGWRCGICGGRIDRERQHPDPLSMSVDHIVPVALLGSNENENLQAAHLRCNLAKGHRT